MTTAPELTMDAEHRYKIGDVALVSVTQVISDILPGWQADPWYMERGTAMHHACALLDAGTLDWSTVAPEIEGRVRAWEKFRKDYPAKMIACEMRLHHPIYNYAGTLDRILVEADAVVVADIKSTIAPQVQIQLGAYSLLWTGAAIHRGAAIELHDDATYKCQWFTKKETEHGGRIFLAALTLHNFKRKAGLL